MRHLASGQAHHTPVAIAGGAGAAQQLDGDACRRCGTRPRRPRDSVMGAPKPRPAAPLPRAHRPRVGLAGHPGEVGGGRSGACADSTRIGRHALTRATRRVAQPSRPHSRAWVVGWVAATCHGDKAPQGLHRRPSGLSHGSRRASRTTRRRLVCRRRRCGRRGACSAPARGPLRRVALRVARLRRMVVAGGLRRDGPRR